MARRVYAIGLNWSRCFGLPSDQRPLLVSGWYRAVWEIDVMSRNKKTFYEILETQANAPCQDILAAHQRKLEKLRSQEASLGHEEFDYQLKLLNLARETLADSWLRRDYDDKLMSRPAAGKAARAQHSVALHPNAETMTRRADALSLRADALALRADAMSINTDAALFGADNPPPGLGSRILGGLQSSMRTVIVVLGTLAALGMVIQAASVVFAVRKIDATVATAAKAEEQMLIQEYYQKYGVRPASAAEARLLERENQRKESEERVAEREKQRMEEEARRFQEESRRIGERVSADLRHAEDEMRYEEARKKAAQEEEKRRQAAAEERRLQREQERWRHVLSR